MDCEVNIVDTPEVEICHLEARLEPTCEEVERYRTIEREVCE